MTKSTLVLVLVALAGTAFGEEKSPSLDVPRACDAKPSAPSEDLYALQLRLSLREERRHDEHVAIAGVGTLGFFYASDAFLAFMSGVASDVNCAVLARLDGVPPICNAPASRKLYVPVAGPFMYLSDPNRSVDFGAKAAVLLTGLGQVAGLGMAIYGAGHLLGLPDAPTPASGEGKRVSWQLLPSAPGALAGGTLQLRM